LTTTAWATQIQHIVQQDYHSQVQYKEVVGKDLAEQGYGGLYGVGKAANCPPRLIVLEYDGSGGDAGTESIALVGKGIVYDTGGLSLKVRFWNKTSLGYLSPAQALNLTLSIPSCSSSHPSHEISGLVLATRWHVWHES
jgi:hypothetical protein